MAIADRSTSGAVSPGTIHTLSHTVTAGSDRILLVAYRSFSFAAPTITYDGTSMTQLVLQEHYFGNTSIFYLLAPTAGTANIVATRPVVDGVQQIALAGVSYTGVDQAAPSYATPTTAFSTAPSVTVSSATGRQVLGFYGHANPPATSITAGSGDTDVIFNRGTEAGAGLLVSDGGASVTVSGTFNASSDWAMVGVDLAEAGGGSSIVPIAMNHYRRRRS